MHITDRARAFALEKHGSQTYGDLPYEFHLRQVVEILNQARVSDLVLAAGWLHDVVEDTSATLFEVREMFGGNIARIVDCCTDPSGGTRAERKAGALVKLRAAPPEARAVKLADRIANMRASIENPKMAKTYRDEFPEFIRACGADIRNQFLTNMAFWLYLNSTEARDAQQRGQVQEVIGLVEKARELSDNCSMWRASLYTDALTTLRKLQ